MARRETRLSETDLRRTIGLRLCEAQRERGLTNDALAREVGLGLRLVQKHRAGDHAPTLENLARYGRVLGRPVAWFFGADNLKDAA